MHEIEVAFIAIGALVLLLELGAGFIRLHQLFVAEPLTALALGIVLGPHVSGLLDVPPPPEGPRVIEEAARVALAFGLIRTALRLRRGFLRERWRTVVVLLLVVMPLMCAATTLVLWAALGVPLLIAWLAAAALTPTDPVLASTIVTGPIAEENVPGEVRHAITAESGLNDGLAYPLVLLPGLLLSKPTGEAWSTWALDRLLFDVGVALAIGAVLGAVSGWTLRRGTRGEPLERTSHLAAVLALGAATLGVCRLLGTDGILGVFVAALAFDLTAGERETVTEEAQEALDPFFTMPVFVLLGAALPLGDWAQLGWRMTAVAVLVLLLRRLPALLLLRRFMPVFARPLDAAFAGWFGPIGVAAVFYAAHALRTHHAREVWAVTTVAVVASALVHGTSAPWLTRAYGRRRRARAEHAEHGATPAPA